MTALTIAMQERDGPCKMIWASIPDGPARFEEKPAAKYQDPYWPEQNEHVCGAANVIMRIARVAA